MRIKPYTVARSWQKFWAGPAKKKVRPLEEQLGGKVVKLHKIKSVFLRATRTVNKNLFIARSDQAQYTTAMKIL
jgi:hypothetical protein